VGFGFHSRVRLAYTGIDPYTGIGYRGIYTGIFSNCGIWALRGVYGPREMGTCPREGPFRDVWTCDTARYTIGFEGLCAAVRNWKHIKQIQRHSKVFLSRRASKLCQRRRHCEHVRLRRQQGPSQQQLAYRQYNLRFISITRSIRAGGTLGMSTRGCPIGGPRKCGPV
jgi:hypothetical protein